jgi:serine/threonine-protein kinase
MLRTIAQVQDEPIAPGQTLAGKYRIDRVLGAGAMGMVLGASHLVLGSRVAIKVMLGGGRKGREHEDRFLREARVASMLKSEHAGKVLDVGVTEQGAPYIVMEFLDGQDLGALLQARGPLPVIDAVTYILQACEAIAEAHALGIVHRDIKPANLFLTTGVTGAPCVKVVDFGIAKQVDGGTALTQTGAVLGSPLYMSPEQIRGSRDVDGRSDIWALGVTLYQLLAGLTPFHAETLMAVVTLINLDPPTPLTDYRPDVAPNLAAVLAQCLEKDPARRWPNVAAFAAALAPHGDAAAAMYAARVAKVQQVEILPSRPTTEIGAPSDAGLAQAASASPAMVASAPRAPLPATPASSSSHRPRARSAGAMVGALLLATVPIATAISFGLRTRAGERVEPRIVPAATDVTPIASATTAAAVSAAAEPAETALPQEPSAVPVASSTPSARPRPGPSTIPRPPAPPRPSPGVVGGARR